MATGKYRSLEEARKKGLIDCFCDEHPSEMQWLKSLNQSVKHRPGNVPTKIEPEIELMQIIHHMLTGNALVSSPDGVLEV